jgi:pyruvate dehydrogenase E2 component (dihydrolipoamide acetyltransferase)
MATDVIMPALGMAQDTGKILRWFKSEGDSVTKGEPLLEIETDKVTVEVEAPGDGTLAGVRAGEGDEVPVGDVVAFLLAAGETVPEQAPSAKPDAPATPTRPSDKVSLGGERARRPLASPKARRLAKERGIDLDALAGDGPIVAADVDRAGAQTVTSSRWRAMADRVTRSWRDVPHFYLRREVDATALDAAKRRTDGVTHTDLLVRSAAAALRKHPHVNASWRDGGVVRHEHVNVSVAVATDDGLVAPVVHGADRLDLAAIAERRRAIVDAAQTGSLRPQDVTGGTFTVSNLGMYRVDEFDAIVTEPQAAILAVGRIAERVVAVDGQPTVRPTLVLSLSFDHRVVDGARGAEFLDTLAQLIEEAT